MQIVVLGSGGREHALIHSLSRSPQVKKIFAIPGNAGTSQIAENISIDLSDFKTIREFCDANHIDMVVVGPEAPLVSGITDYLEAQNIRVFGPNKAASQLEGSKIFTKNLCQKYNIPTAAYQAFNSINKAKQYIESLPEQKLVIKADGLAAGKGVIITNTTQDAVDAINTLQTNNLVIEEFLEGPEVSFFALTDGQNSRFFASAQDHKKVGEGETGPNTGGMGAFSPSQFESNEFINEIMDHIIVPTVNALKNEGIKYKGTLFAGLILTKSGPKLLEYNARFGDPETEAMLLRLDSDLAQIFSDCIDEKLDKSSIEFSQDEAITVIYCSNGYPGEYQKGEEIKNLDRVDSNINIFHSGTIMKDKKCLSNGGRVLAVSSKATILDEARSNVYKALQVIDFPNGFYRNDIGKK